MLNCIQNTKKISINEFALRINSIVKDCETYDMKKKMEVNSNLEEESKRYIPTLLKKNIYFKKHMTVANQLSSGSSREALREREQTKLSETKAPSQTNQTKQVNFNKRSASMYVNNIPKNEVLIT